MAQPGPRAEARLRPAPAGARAPRGLSSEALKFWRAVAKVLISEGVLSVVDVPAFVVMAEHYAIARRCLEKINAAGLTVLDAGGGIRKHPLLQVWRDNSTAYLKYATQFGLTPASRKDMKRTAEEDAPTLAEYLAAMVADALGSQEEDE